MLRPGLFIGCRGFDYDHWAGSFYPKDLRPQKRLEFYAERFGTVLFQRTYHAPPDPEDVRRWADSTPESFRFSFVSPREIAAEHGLEGPAALSEVERFLDHVRPLEGRLGTVIHVVPRSMRIHVRLLGEFLEALPRDVRHSMEFNSTDWFVDRTRESLERHDAALSIHDSPECVAPWWITAEHVLVRRYGALGKGEGKYTSDEVQRIASRIAEDVRPEKSAYLYFENDQEGFACEHALLARDLFVG